MSEESNVTPMESPSPAEVTNTDIHMIPKSRFDEVNNKAKDLQAQLESFQRQQAEIEEAKLVEQNKWRELAEQRQAEIDRLQTLESEVNRFREGFTSTLESRLSQIPDDKKHLVPEYDDPIKLSAWLDKALPDLVTPSKPTPPKLDGGSGSTGAQTVLSANVASVADLARSYGVNINEERLATLASTKRKPTNLGE